MRPDVRVLVQRRDDVRVTASSPAPAQPQRLCPRCSTLARTVETHCPYCAGAYRRRGLGPIAAMLAAATAVVLVAVALMFVAFGDQLDGELDDSVELVQRDLDGDVRRLERRLVRELDERLPAPAAP